MNILKYHKCHCCIDHIFSFWVEVMKNISYLSNISWMSPIWVEITSYKISCQVSWESIIKLVIEWEHLSLTYFIGVHLNVRYISFNRIHNFVNILFDSFVKFVLNISFLMQMWLKFNALKVYLLEKLQTFLSWIHIVLHARLLLATPKHLKSYLFMLEWLLL